MFVPKYKLQSLHFERVLVNLNQNILKCNAELLQDKWVRRVTGNEDINDLVFEWFNDGTFRSIPCDRHSTIPGRL